MLWFSSDWHLGHRNIIRFTGRPVDDLDHMHSTIVDTMNDLVGPGDHLVLVGDIAMGDLDQTLPILRTRLTAGRVTLVPGNHDRCHPHMSKDVRKLDRWRQRYRTAGGVADICYPSWLVPEPGPRVQVCHFPYLSDQADYRGRRFAEHQLVDDGGWLVCGHVHGAWQQSGRMINVGVDAWAGQPVSWETITDRIAQGPADVPADRWVGASPVLSTL